MSDDFTPPPRRHAPEDLRQRISAELASARGRTRRRGRVLAPVAAALVLVAAVGGVAGATRLSEQRDLVPRDRPSATPTSRTTPTPAASPSSSPTATPSARPQTLELRGMTEAQIRRDTQSCLEVDAGDQPAPRRGQLRTRYAAIQPVITNDTSTITERVLFLQDDLGQYQCIDGVENGWQTLSSHGFRPTAKVPGGEASNGANGQSASCSKKAGSEVSSEVLLEVDPRRVAGARVTLVSAGRAVRAVDVPVDGESLYVAVRLTGTAARLPMSFRVELHDQQGRILPVQPDGAADTRPAQRLSFALRSCAELEKLQGESQPKPLTRPTSDRAGVATCLQLVDEDGNQDFDLDRASAEVTISTRTEWGAVLSDGTRYLGCSLYPTKEISRSVPVTDNPATAKKLFAWATNPIVPNGESLWAAGHLPGATRIAYTLPDGTVASATISPNGFWMVKTQTATAFDQQENNADWKPVTVTVTRHGRTTTYTIPWTEQTMCHQISHGC